MKKRREDQTVSSRRLLRTLQAWLLSLQRNAIRQPKIWLVVAAVVFLGAVAATSKLQMLLAIDDLIDPDFHTYSELTNLSTSFPDKNDLFLVVGPRDPAAIPSKVAICDLKGWIQRQVDTRDDIEVVLGSFGVRKPVTSNGRVRFPPLISIDCDRLWEPETEKIRAALQELSRSPWGKTLISNKANDLSVTLYLADASKNKRFGNFDTAVVGQIQKDFEDEFGSRHPELKAEWFGVAAYQKFIRAGFDQTAWLNVGTAFITLALFWVVFRSLRAAVIFLATVTYSSVLVYGGLALAGCPIDVLTNSLTLMLVIASLEDFVFVAHQNAINRVSWRRSFRQLLAPSFFTSFTTFVGFGSLYASDLGVIRRFGLWAAIAAMLECVVVFFLLPAALQQFPRLRAWCVPAKSAQGFRWFDKVARWRLPRAVAFSLLGAYLVGTFGVRSLHVSDSPPNIFPKNHEVRRGMRSLEASRGWDTAVSLVFKDVDPRGRNESVIAELRKSPIVAAVESPYAAEDYLTSGASPQNKDTIMRYWRSSVAGRRLVSYDDQARAMLYLKDTDIVEITRLSDQARRLCPKGECYLAGSLISYAEFGDRVLGTLMESLSVSLALVSIVLLFLIRAHGAPKASYLLLSAMWGPMAMLCIFYLFKIPVFYITSMFASILVGEAGNNTIQYLFGSRGRGGVEHGFESRGTASVIVTLSMMTLACVFFFSYFAPLRILGGLLILGFAMALLGDLWLLKGLLGLGAPLVDVKVAVEPEAVRGGHPA
jgi:predicted RND superfamily exporter protein